VNGLSNALPVGVAPEDMGGHRRGAAQLTTKGKAEFRHQCEFSYEKARRHSGEIGDGLLRFPSAATPLRDRPPVLATDEPVIGCRWGVQ
jgi:hypothetical protein